MYDTIGYWLLAQFSKNILNTSDIGKNSSFAVSVKIVPIGIFIDFYHYMKKNS